MSADRTVFEFFEVLGWLIAAVGVLALIGFSSMFILWVFSLFEDRRAAAAWRDFKPEDILEEQPARQSVTGAHDAKPADDKSPLPVHWRQPTEFFSEDEYSLPNLIAWLDAKYARHKELEDMHAADALRAYAVLLSKGIQP